MKLLTTWEFGMTASCSIVATGVITIWVQDNTMERIVMATWTIERIQLDGQNVVQMILKTTSILNQIFVLNESIPQ